MTITHYLDDDRGYIISREELRKDFDFMTDEERQEYNKYTAVINDNVVR